jgi:hypothetical protein
MNYFVVTHHALEWPLPSFMQPISTVPAGEGVLDLSTDHPHLAGRGPELSEYATLFALRRHLQASWSASGRPADADMIGVGHYRRFPVTRPIGRPSDIYGVVSSEEFTKLPADTFLPPTGSLLLPSICNVGTVLGQYGRNHVLRDLLHFMAIAIDLDVIAERAAAQWLSQGVMVAAPSIGVYPAGWYVHVLEQLERVVEAFESSAAVPRDGYQRRAVGFCLERLHGMLVGQLLSQWPGDRVLANPAVIVSDEGSYTLGD